MCRHTLIAAITISSTVPIIDAPIPAPVRLHRRFLPPWMVRSSERRGPRGTDAFYLFSVGPLRFIDSSKYACTRNSRKARDFGESTGNRKEIRPKVLGKSFKPHFHAPERIDFLLRFWITERADGKAGANASAAYYDVEIPGNTSTLTNK